MSDTGTSAPSRAPVEAHADPRPRCPGTTRDGRPCGAPPLVNGSCLAHSGMDPAQLKAWQKLGGKAAHAGPVWIPPADFSNADAVREWLQAIADAIVRRELAPSVARSVGALASVGLRASEMRLAEQVGRLARRLDALQAPPAARGRRS
jgi:hypothetical protein